jgi:peroxiredoxin family protein
MNRVMQAIVRKAKGLTLALALAAALALPRLSLALDRVVLREGNKVVEGTIVRELDGNIWIKVVENGVEKQVRYSPDQILKVERNVEGGKAASADAAKAAPVAGAATPAEKLPAAPAKSDAKTENKAEAATAAAPVAAAAKPASTGKKVPKAAIITLGDRTNGEMVGVYFTAHALRAAVKDLEKEVGNDGSGIIVFRIYSGGGLGLEIPKMWDVIRNEYMKKFRCVAWIESAISAAAMTAHCMEEIYFTSQANYGACTGWSGDLVAVKGMELQEYITKMQVVSRQAGHHPLIMTAMQVQQPLSATVMPDGTVKFYEDDTSGNIIVNRKGEILTLNAHTAREIKFSKGTADTLEELTKLMGYEELEWVGENVKGVTWPVTRPERENMDFRRKTKYDEDRTNEYFRRYQTEVAFAESVDREDRPKFVGKARQTLEQFKSMMRNNPAFNLMVFNSETPDRFNEWIEEQEKILKDLLR